MIVKEAVAVSLVLAASAFLASAPKSSQTTSQGVYTAAQAEQGHTLYTAKCVECHQADMKGKGQAPALVGKDFTSQWVGATLDQLFDVIHNTMPADNPGTLTRDQSADLLAFILSSNNFPAGKTALPSDEASLTKIQFTAPPSTAPSSSSSQTSSSQN